ncbi:MAG: SDR family oxidoreductase [Polyangia bacterium]
MRVFVTGATGFVGFAVVKELTHAGHKVLGLARSEAGARSLAGAGAEVQRGALEDLDSLRRGAADADAVIHTAFIHDFLNYGAAAEADRRAIEALGEVLAGSHRPLLVTAGVARLAPGRTATEDETLDLAAAAVPRQSEPVAMALAARGVRALVMRLPPSVHGRGDHGFVPRLVQIAREKGVSAYIGDGSNRWPAVHRDDAARLYRLALEKAPAGTRLNAIADEGVPIRDLAAVIGRRLGLPVVAKSAAEAQDHFGWLAPFLALDVPGSSARTRERLGWQPTQPGLLADLDQPHYFET